MEEQTVKNALETMWKGAIRLKFLLLYRRLLEKLRITTNPLVILDGLGDDVWNYEKWIQATK